MNSHLARLKRIIRDPAGALVGVIVLPWMPLLGCGARLVELVCTEEFQVAVVEEGEGDVYLEGGGVRV